MKKFTKQFANKTLFKPTRWLLVALMLLVGTSSIVAANSTKSDGNYRLYFQFTDGDNWWNGSGCYHYAWIWANGGAGQIQRIYKVGTTSNASTGSTTDVFYMNIPKDMILYGMILFRGKDAGPANGSTTWPADASYSWHNKTGDIVLPNNISTYNLVTAVKQDNTTVTQSSRYTSVSVASTTLTATNAKSGSGTQADPYVFDENTTMKLSASATIDDHNFQIQLAYGSSTSMKTSGSSQSISVTLTTAATATAYNVTYTPCLGGSTSYKGTASTKTIYYKTEKSCETPSITLSNASVAYNGSAQKPTITIVGGATPTKVKYNGTEYQNGPTNAGTYTVTVWADENGDYCSLEGEEAGDFIITQKTPDKDDFVYTNQTVTYNGEEQSVDVEWKDGYEKTGAITITYKQGDEVKDPINAGTYDVWVTSAASDNFNATEYEINKGTLTITLVKITDVPSNFQLSKTSYNYGEEAKPTVSLKQGSSLIEEGLGVITPIYYNSQNEVVSEPTEVGTYTVKITMTEGNGYSAITEPTEVGTFTITCPTPAQPQLTIAEGDKVKVCEDKPNTDGYITISNFGSYSNCKLYLGSVDNENEITSNKIAVNAARTYTIIVENACGESSENSIAIEEEILTPTLTSITIEPNTDKVCAGDNNVTLTCNLVDAVGTPTYKWTKNGEPVGDNSNTIEAGVLERNTTFSVSVILDNSGCTKEFTASKEIEVKVRPEAPNLGSTGETICYGTLVNLPMVDNNDANNQINWYNGKLVKPTNVSVLETTTFYAEAVSENGLGCASADRTEFTVTVNALPAITLTADNANVNVGETVTLTAAGSNFTSLDWSSTGGDFTLGANNTATLTSDEDANITVTVTATSNDGCTATATIQVIFSSEDCEAESSANYIEVLCRDANNGRSMYCYAWTGSNTEKLGAWPGQKTKDGDYTYNGTKYAYWKIEGDAINIIFNNGSGTKTGDITGLEKGKRYVFSISADYKTVTKTVNGQAIFMPEVETTSITPVRNGNTTNVTLEGRVVKKGCADIAWYGFQYSTDGGETYKDIQVGTSDLDLGSTFTYTQAFELGTYMFRSKIINNNGSKVYGEAVRVTVAERDLTIAAIHDDTDVDTDIYYDFAGLYMSSITKATNVEIASYTWYKDGAVYNPTYTASTAFGDTYINANGTNNIRPNQTGTYKLVVALSNGATLESNVITITKASKVNASNILTASNRTLPVISVRTNKDFPTCKSGYPSAIADDMKKKRSVDVKIFDKNGNLYYDRKARMNYRGSSSLNFVKKSYAFCPGDEMCGDVEKGLDYVITKKVNMFNLGAKDKDWVLYAAAADPSMMRNRIVFDTYKEMTGEWGVNSMYVELVVDGEYKGVYVFMDKITNNKDRVNITNAAGFIVKFDKTDTADRYVNGQDDDSDEKTFVTSRTGKKGIPTYGTTVDQMFEIEYPEKDDNKANWSNIVSSIQRRFENFETALEKGDYATVRSIIDYTSWADWFILNEYIKNQDAYRASCIFVYNGEKIEARPVWDQELSMKNTCRTSHGCDNPEGLLITTASIYKDAFPAPFWFTGGDENIKGGLLKDGCFISMIKERWAMHVAAGAPLDSETLQDLIEKFDGELTAENGSSSLNTAQLREAKFWDGKTRSTCEGGDTGYGDTDYGREKDNIEAWITTDNRDEKLGGLIHDMEGELTGGISITMVPADGTVTPWVPVKVTVNVPNGDEYTYDDNSITKDITLANDKAITSKNGDVYTYTFPRPEAWGVGNNNGKAKDTRSYIISASLVDQSTECPGLFTDAVVQVKLADEGDDNCIE